MQLEKQCLNCAFYEPYYVKGFCCNFYKKDIGQCKKYLKTVTPNESCNKWLIERPLNSKRKEMAINTIVDIGNKLAAIEEILKAEIEREKINNKNS